MRDRRIINTNIRLDMTRVADRRAYELLTTMDRKKCKSYSKLVVIAINEYFDRQERLEDDPYLETRAKEDAFLLRIIDTVREAAQGILPFSLLSGIMRAAQTAPSSSDNGDEAEEAADEALEFADSF